MRKLFASLFSLALVFVFSVHPTFAAPHKDKDCKDFKSWQQAQQYFESHGGSKKNNYDGLDRDHDGLACENLKGFNPSHKNPNDSKGKSTTKQATHNTSSNHNTVSKHESSSAVKKSSTGGKLPKTATDYPLASLLGAIMLLAGVATLKFA